MPGPGFWIAIAVSIGIIGLLTWVGALVSRGSDERDWPDRQDRPLIPTPDRDDKDGGFLF